MRSTMQDDQLTIDAIRRHVVAVHPDGEVVTATADGSRTRSYAELGERPSRLASALRGLGVDGDQRVATFQWNNVEHLEAYLAVPSMGAVLHTLNIRLFPEQLVYVANHAEDHVVIVDDSLVGLLAPRLEEMTTVEHVVVAGPEAATADLDALRADETPLETVEFAESHGAGAAAQAFRQTGSGLDKARALQCLSMAVYYEAASESHAGQQAVAQVVLNRVAHPAYPASVCGVVFQGSERTTGCQFSFTCDGSLGRRPSRRGWAVAQSVALAALAGEVYRPIGLATHYHTHYVNPYWAASLDFIRSIGAHRFYRWRGGAGTAGAFTDAYAGSEPLAAPNVARAEASTPGPVDPAPPANATIGLGSTPQPPVGAPAASAQQASEKLPQSGRVREEYANSGRWIAEPGKSD